MTWAILGALADPLVPSRVWLERLALLVPGPTATRWLLVADVMGLVALGSAGRWPLLGVPGALAVGFVALNVVSMVVTDFYLGLALFHLAVGLTAAVVLWRSRWLGLAFLALCLLLGVVT